jgi:hypothetical protein
MKEIHLQKPMNFGSNPKQITRKINLVQLRSDTHLNNLRSNSKSSKSKKRVYESPYKKPTLIEDQKIKLKHALTPQVKNGQ